MRTQHGPSRLPSARATLTDRQHTTTWIVYCLTIPHRTQAQLTLLNRTAASRPPAGFSLPSSLTHLPLPVTFAPNPRDHRVRRIPYLDHRGMATIRTRMTIAACIASLGVVVRCGGVRSGSHGRGRCYSAPPPGAGRLLWLSVAMASVATSGSCSRSWGSPWPFRGLGALGPR